MGAMDHERGADGICRYCDEAWPCTVAEIRRELAEYIRSNIQPPFDIYDESRVQGQEMDANSIDY